LQDARLSLQYFYTLLNKTVEIVNNFRKESNPLGIHAQPQRLQFTYFIPETEDEHDVPLIGEALKWV